MEVGLKIHTDRRGLHKYKIKNAKTQVCVVHKGRPVAGVINEVFAKDEAAVWGVTLGDGEDEEDGFKVRVYTVCGMVAWALHFPVPPNPNQNSLPYPNTQKIQTNIPLTQPSLPYLDTKY
jgi:hypothetical protein